MVNAYPILSVLLIFALSLLFVRIGSVALRMTGLSPDVASFQAASAFSGAGYTTEEAEQTVATPGRRKIVKALIRLGSIGLLGAISSLVLSFSDTGGQDALTLAYILGGAGGLVLVARSSRFNDLVTPVIEWALSRTTDLDVRDYTQVLGLQREYRVAEIEVEKSDWLANDTPANLSLGEEGILLLAIERDDEYVGAPDAETEIRPGDTVVLYGKEDRLQELSDRDAGDVDAHEDAKEAHEEILEAQEQRI